MTSSMVGPRNSKVLPETKLAQKKDIVTAWWSAAHLIHYSFTNSSETITSIKYAQQSNEMHQKLQCLRPALFNRKGSILLHDNTQPYIAEPVLQKLNELGYNVCLSHHVHPTSLQPTTTS